MPRFLVSIYHPDDYAPEISEDEAMMRGIDALNDDMRAAGVRVFVGGLRPVSDARTVRAHPNDEVLIFDGPHLAGKEHAGGFWVLEVADMNEALTWAGRAAKACRAPVEVRQFS